MTTSMSPEIVRQEVAFAGDAPEPQADTPPSTSMLDHTVERATKILYQNTSRRGVLARLGKGVLGILGLQAAALLPLDRTVPEAEASNHLCSDTKYCNMYGARCDCCGGNTGGCICPYGTTVGSFWWGCCGGNYVRYYDCCGGNVTCNCTWCNRTNAPSRTPNSHWIDWCSGSGTYRCTVACWAGEGC